MSQPFIQLVDFRLLATSCVVALLTCVTGFILIKTVLRSQGYRRAMWIVIAGCAVSFGIWSSQLLVIFSLAVLVDIQLASSEVIESGLNVLGAVTAAYVVLGRHNPTHTSLFAGLLLGCGVLSCALLQCAALAGDAQLIYSPSLIALGLILAPSAGVAAIAVARASRRNDQYFRRPKFLSSVGILSLAMCGAPAAILASTRVAGMRVGLPHAVVAPQWAALLGGSAILVLLGVLLAERLDRERGHASDHALRVTTLYERERKANLTLQQALLPLEFPREFHMTFSSVYLPQSEESRVGGDWYDAFPLPDGRIALSIGDVSGHGLAAALTMGVVRQAIRTATQIGALTPAEIFPIIDRVLAASDYPAITTAAIAFLDPISLEVWYASAGHPPAAIIAPSGEVTQLAYGGSPLGITHDVITEDHVLYLEPGSTLVFYTDGCTEYSRNVIEGELRFRQVLAEVALHARHTNLPPTAYASEIATRLFSQSKRLDDAAIFCITPAATIPSFQLSILDFTRSRKSIRNAATRVLQGLHFSPAACAAARAAALIDVDALLEDMEVRAFGHHEGVIEVSMMPYAEHVEFSVRDYTTWSNSSWLADHSQTAFSHRVRKPLRGGSAHVVQHAIGQTVRVLIDRPPVGELSEA